MDYDLSPEGYWQVNEQKFLKKFDALRYAGKKNWQAIKYIFFDHVWNNFDRKSLGTVSLNALYQQRAKQLRDEYDYLILYFSGGADSYNVMRSFIDNGIKLDEVCVKWPMAAINAGVYVPNTIDLSARNTLSEWDFAIKPVLKWLSQRHPDIKITVVDWTENFSEKTYSEDLFLHVNNFTDVEIPFLMSYSGSEKYYIEKGKKVASIYGIEKPLVAYRDKKWYMGFIDMATAMGTPSLVNPHGTEYFYWSPKFPMLTFEQAHTVCEFLDKNIHFKKYFLSDEANNWSMEDWILSRRIQNKICNSILYDNWNGNFQALKPDIPDRADKQFWIFEHPELSYVRDHYIDMNSLFLSQIDGSYVYNNDILNYQSIFQKKQRGIYRRVYSKWHYVKVQGNY